LLISRFTSARPTMAVNSASSSSTSGAEVSGAAGSAGATVPESVAAPISTPMMSSAPFASELTRSMRTTEPACVMSQSSKAAVESSSTTTPLRRPPSTRTDRAVSVALAVTHTPSAPDPLTTQSSTVAEALSRTTRLL
jgi:hypothetical protein